MDPVDLDEIRQALEDSPRVDARRIELRVEDGDIVLAGAVAEPEEASSAELVIQQHTDRVINRLRVDRGLREGIQTAVDTEQAIPEEGEILVGSTDMLAGPESEITSDPARAFQENEPWDPPSEPSLVPTAAEAAGDVSMGDGGAITAEPGTAADIPRSEYSAADLGQDELEAAGRGASLPSLDPEAVADERPSPDPVGVDPLGRTPDGRDEPMVDQVPGTPPGPGAVAADTVDGGGIGGTAATETGSAGADTAAADPARATGGTALGTGTERGPQGRDDPPLREDFPDSEV